MITRAHIACSVLATCVLSLCYAQAATAQEAASKFEITPFASYRVGGHFQQLDADLKFDLGESSAYGIIFNGFVRDNAQWELLYSHQDTKVDTQGLFAGNPLVDIGIDYYHLGGTYLFDGTNARPFIAMTLGMSRFDPEPAEFSPENYFSGSFGGGVQLLSNKRLGLRLEVRTTTTLVGKNSSIFCRSNDGAGVCLIEFDGTLLTQWEARAGLVLRF